MSATVRKIKTIGNIEEVKEKLKTAKIPKEFVLSDSEVIKDVGKFINTHLTVLETEKLTYLHRPYFDRLKKVLDTLKIDIEIKETEEFE